MGIKTYFPVTNVTGLFFSQFFESCIKDYIPYTSQPIFEETQDYSGGKRKKRKSKKNKSNKKKSKNKKSKKRYSRKYR